MSDSAIVRNHLTLEGIASLPFSAGVAKDGRPYFSFWVSHTSDDSASLRVRVSIYGAKPVEAIKRVISPGSHVHVEGSLFTFRARNKPATVEVEATKVQLDCKRVPWYEQANKENSGC